MKLSDAAIVGNTDGRQILQAKGYLKPIFVIPQLGISVDFKQKTKSFPLLNHSNRNTFIVGYIGRIIKLKGIDTLLKAVSLMEQRTITLIIGRGDELPELKKTANALGIEERVIFIDTVPHEEIAGYLEAIDVLVLPSLTGKDWKEQFGQVLIEAMACGTPVVGSDSGAIPDVIGDAGLIFKEGDAVDLAEKLQIMMNEEFREDLRQRGIKRVKTYFTHQKVAAATHTVYRFIMGGKLPETFSYSK
jgi:glycosyltransferase involved in cell wall biosynthesis